MIIKVNRIEFLKSIKIVEKTISENKIKPVISGIYIETKGVNLFFCGTNLETTITTEMPCSEIIEGGKLVFQYQLVEEYLKELKDEIISFKEKDGILLIESSDSSSEFSLMNVEDYPKLSWDENFEKETPKFQIESDEMATILEKVKYAAGPSTDKLEYNCVRIETQENTLKFVTTDTYRLVFLKKIFENTLEELSVSVPLNAIEALTKLMRGTSNQNVKFYYINKHVFVKMEDCLVITRVIDLAFPNYKGVLQNNLYNKKLTINVEEIIKTLKRISIFVRNNTEAKYGATFTIEDKHMNINGISDIAEINENIVVDYQGEGIKISLNVKFMLDYIQSLNKDKNVIIEFTSSNSSIRITEENNEDYIYVLMPLALRD